TVAHACHPGSALAEPPRSQSARLLAFEPPAPAKRHPYGPPLAPSAPPETTACRPFKPEYFLAILHRRHHQMQWQSRCPELAFKLRGHHSFFNQRTSADAVDSPR